MKKILLLCLAFAGMSSLLHSAVLVSLSGVSSVGTTTNAPTSNVFASNEQSLNFSGQPVDSALGWRWDSASSKRDISQSFQVVSAITFDKMTFKIGGADLPSVLQDNSAATFTLSIYKLSSASALPSDASAQVVSQQSGSFASFAAGMATASGNITGTKYNYLTFDFDNVSLTESGYYAVVLSFNATATGYNLAMAMNTNNNVYTQGTGAVNYNEGGWAGSSDFYFYAQSVPEPKATAMLFGSVVILFSQALKRRR